MIATQQPLPVARETVRPLPRRIPTPSTEPAYDDEHAADRAGGTLTHGALALDLAVADRAAAATRHLSVVGGRNTLRDRDDPFFAPQQTPRVALPDPRSWSGRFVQALVEVLAGDRPAAQLLRWTDHRVYNDVLNRVRALGPSGSAQRGDRGRAMVRSVHVCEPRDGVAEVAVHVNHGGRSRAVAVRLEGLDGRWRCTALQLG